MLRWGRRPRIWGRDGGPGLQAVWGIAPDRTAIRVCALRIPDARGREEWPGAGADQARGAGSPCAGCCTTKGSTMTTAKRDPWAHTDHSAHSISGPIGCFPCANLRRAAVAPVGNEVSGETCTRCGLPVRRALGHSSHVCPSSDARDGAGARRSAFARCRAGSATDADRVALATRSSTGETGAHAEVQGGQARAGAPCVVAIAWIAGNNHRRQHQIR